MNEEQLQISRNSFGPDHLKTITYMNNLGRAYTMANRLNEALPLFERVFEVRTSTLPAGHPDILTAMNNLAETYEQIGRMKEGIELLEKVVALRKDKLGPDHPDTIISMGNLAKAYRAAYRPRDAIPLFEDALKYRRAHLPPGHPDTLFMVSGLACAYVDSEQWTKAEPLLRELLKLQKLSPKDAWVRFYNSSQLGLTLSAQGKYPEAEGLLIEGYEGMLANEAKIPAARQKDLVKAAAWIVPFFEASGQPQKAAAWRQKLASTVVTPKPAP